MPINADLTIVRSAYDILAFALQLKKHSLIENIYVDKNNIHYIRTKWGFEKTERYNQRIALKRKERQFDRLSDDFKYLKHDYDLLLQRKTGLNKHLLKNTEIIRSHRKEKGFLKKHLKEVLDQNIALDKRMERMLKQEDNQQQQLVKLKKTRDNLLEQNTILNEKTRQQKSQINALSKTIDELKLRHSMLENA